MSAQKKLLVIDDDRDFVAFMSLFLQDHGYEVVVAFDGGEGLDKARAERPDLILLDITMPETTGVRFYREVRGDPALREIPVVMVTGVMEEFERFISTRRQVPPPDGYFSKPLDQEALLAEIARLLDAGS